MAYQRYIQGMGWVPANGPKSGPPGPLVLGPVGGLSSSDLFRSPLFIGAIALGALVLWASSKSKPAPRRRRRRNPGKPPKRKTFSHYHGPNLRPGRCHTCATPLKKGAGHLYRSGPARGFSRFRAFCSGCRPAK